MQCRKTNPYMCGVLERHYYKPEWKTGAGTNGYLYGKTNLDPTLYHNKSKFGNQKKKLKPRLLKKCSMNFGL